MTGAASADFDAIIVGGGPAGSTCARFLVRGGARVASVDRAPFPRVKLCGGWLSRAIWDELEVPSRDSPGQLWEWNPCHVSYLGQDRAIRCRGWFIRRYELDDFLLRASGAELHLGVEVRDVTRDVEGYWSVAGLRAPPLDRGRRHALSCRAPSTTPAAAHRTRGARRSTSSAPIATPSPAHAPGGTASPSCCCTTICAVTLGTCPRPSG